MRRPERWRAAVIPLLLLAALELYTRSAAAGSDALAPPSAALQAWWGALRDGSCGRPRPSRWARAAAGLALGGGLGVLAGHAAGPVAARGGGGLSQHRAAAAGAVGGADPAAMLVFGFGLRMEAAVVAFATLWPVLVLTQAAVRQVEPQLLEVSAALELSAWQRARWIVLPAMLPRLFVALRLAVAIALVVAVTVEIAANPHGMGYAMMIAQQSLDPALMLAWLLWIGVVGWTPQRHHAAAAAGRGAPHGGPCVRHARAATWPASLALLAGCSALWWLAAHGRLGQPRLPAHARGGTAAAAGRGAAAG
jgi:sulfonate transport system permease protein